MPQEDIDEIANSDEPDQTASLIWVCTVCPDLTIHKLRKYGINFYTDIFKRIYMI